MGKFSKEKGKRGEREAAKKISDILELPMRRGVQHKGGENSPDILGLYGVHIEVKRDESTLGKKIYKVMELTGHPVVANGIYIANLDELKTLRNPIHASVQITSGMYAALEQSTRDAGKSNVPIVVSRRNGRQWLVFMDRNRLNELRNIIHEL